MKFNCTGTAGHGSLLLKNTAGEKVNYILNQMTELRKSEAKKLDSNPNFTIGDVTTINLTIINGGVQSNVVPPIMSITFDVRIAIDRSHDEFVATVISAELQNLKLSSHKSNVSVQSFLRRSRRWCSPTIRAKRAACGAY